MTYMVATLFGALGNGSVFPADRSLDRILPRVIDACSRWTFPLVYRSFIEGDRGKDVGTNGRRFRPDRFLAEVGDMASRGRFATLEVFEKAALEQKRDPIFYLQIEKLWHYRYGSGYSPTTRHGAAHSITVAVHHSLGQEVIDTWLEEAKALFQATDGIVGFVEGQTPWGQPVGSSGFQTRLVNYRVKDILEGDYGWFPRSPSETRITDRIAFLPWGLFLGPGHVAALGGMQAVSSLSAFPVIEALGDERVFLALTPWPQATDDLMIQRARNALRQIVV